MRMNRLQRDGDLVKSLACGLALLAAGAAACTLRGFFFAGEMYRFLTVWFALCAGLAIGIRILYKAGGKEGSGGTRIIGRSAVTHPAARRQLTGMKGDVSAQSWAVSGSSTAKHAPEMGPGSRGNVQAPGWETLHKPITRASVILLPGCSLAILVLYGIHALQGSLSLQGTLNELLRWGLYASFALLALCAAGARAGRYILAVLWHSLGLTISLSALLAVCGGLPLPYAVAYSPSPEVSATGARLAGLLQYPNTFGAMMAVFLLERLFAAAYGLERVEAGKAGAAGGVKRRINTGVEARGSADGGVEKDNATGREKCRSADGGDEKDNATGRKECGSADGEMKPEEAAGGDERAAVSAAAWLSAVRLLPLFPYAAALLLSESRGAWLAAAAACAAALLWKRQLCVPLLLTGAAPVAGAALLYRQLARTGLAVTPLPGLLLLAGLSAGALLAGLWVHRRGSRAAGGRRAAMLALAAAGWTAAGSAVLMHVRARITGPSPTAGARGLMYRDAWKLAAEAPWLGRGGETWRQSYLAAQSRPYVGSQVHSGYLDILLNLGIAGVTAVLLLLLAAGWLIIQASPRLLPPLLVIILHSAADFDWSYGLMWLLLFLLPAWALAEAKHGATAPTAGPPACLQSIAAPAPRYTDYAQPASGRQLFLPMRVWRNAGITLICALACTFSLLSFQALRGSVVYKQAARNADPAARTALLRQSLEWNPRDPQTAVALSRLLPLEQGNALLLNALKYSPGNAALHWELAERDMNGSDPGAALYRIRQSLRLDVFNTAKRQAAVEGMLELSRRALAAEDWQKAADSAAAGLELLREYRLLAVNEADKGQQHNDRGFGLKQEAEGTGLRLRNVLAIALHNEKEDDS